MESIKIILIVLIALIMVACQPIKSTPQKVQVLPTKSILNMEFVEVPGGTFKMGHELFGPIHKVKLDSFWIMKYELTSAQFAEFLKAKGRKVTESSALPAFGMKRAEVDEFIVWLNSESETQFELPSEAQWEYAARGGLEGMDYPWGPKFVQKRAAIIDDPVAPVGSYPPNGFGLYDMCGNVGEITRGAYYEYSSKAVTNPEPPVLIMTDKKSPFIARGLGVGSPFNQVWNRASMNFVDIEMIDKIGFRLVIKNSPDIVDKMKPWRK
jgi:formylglycine-generating enzyme